MSVDHHIVPPNQALPFPSLAAMRSTHRELLHSRRDDGSNDGFLADVVAFLQRGQPTGALLEDDDERQSAQSLLNFWSNALYRANGESFDATLVDFDSTLAPIIPDEDNPYRGLDAFDEWDQHRFFGRQHLVAELVERLERQRLLAIMGPSGSGKSSLVRAGLIPVLKHGALPDSEGWSYLPALVPGSEPLIALARTLRPPEAEATWIAAQVARFIDDPTHLTQLVEARENAVSVLVIDQFEELFTLCDDNTARNAFINNLLHLAQTSTYPHRVVLTMRSDFETFVARVPRLQAMVADGRIQVTPLNAAELRDAIERPAEQIGLKFDPGVVDSLLQDILGEPAALPLLQFTLLKLWEQRDHNRVMLEDYRRIGGGRLALARSADTLYQHLIPEDQVTARRILLRLVRPGTGLEVTSSRVLRTTLLQVGEDPGRIQRVLERLLHARLLRLTPGATPDDDTVEVAHEALVRNWPTLVEWLNDERTAIATRRRLEERAREWVRLGREQAGLFDEVQLAEAARWLRSAEAANLGYDAALVDMVAASRDAIRAERAAQEAAHQREFVQVQALAQEQQRRAEAERARAEAQSHSSYLLRLLVAALGMIAVLAVIAAALAFRSATTANEQRGIANSDRATALAAVNAQSTQLAISNTAQTEANAAQAQAQANAGTAAAAQRTAVAARDDSASQTRLARAGQLAAQAQLDLAEYPQRSLLLAIEAMAATGRAQEPAAPAAANALLKGLRTLGGRGFGGSSTLMTPDGNSFIAITQDDNTQQIVIRVTDSPTATGRVLRGITSGSTIGLMRLSDDGRHLAANNVGVLRVWDLDDLYADPQIAAGIGPAFTALVWSPDGRLIAGDDAGNVAIWTLDDAGQPGSPQVLQQQRGRITSLAVCPNGRWLFSSNTGDGIARRWSLANPEPVPFRINTGSPDINRIACSPDSSTFLTGSSDGRVFLWQANSSGNVSAPVLAGHQGAITVAAFSPDGQWATTGSADTTVRIWGVRNRSRQFALLGHTAAVTDIAWSADSRWLASSSSDGTLRLWDMSAGNPQATVLVLRGHEGGVSSVAISPDNQHVVSYGDDGIARIWDLTNPYPAAIAILASINGFAAVPDQFTLDDITRVTDPIDLACRTVGRNLTREEWAAYVGAPSTYRATCP